jgi:hypothetical protein
MEGQTLSPSLTNFQDWCAQHDYPLSAPTKDPVILIGSAFYLLERGILAGAEAEDWFQIQSRRLGTLPSEDKQPQTRHTMLAGLVAVKRMKTDATLTLDQQTGEIGAEVFRVVPAEGLTVAGIDEAMVALNAVIDLWLIVRDQVLQETVKENSYAKAQSFVDEMIVDHLTSDWKPATTDQSISLSTDGTALYPDGDTKIVTPREDARAAALAAYDAKPCVSDLDLYNQNKDIFDALGIEYNPVKDDSYVNNYNRTCRSAVGIKDGISMALPRRCGATRRRTVYITRTGSTCAVRLLSHSTTPLPDGRGRWIFAGGVVSEELEVPLEGLAKAFKRALGGFYISG